MSISSEITRLTQAKADIKTAIENKGVTVPSSAKLDDYHDYIDDIEQGGSGGGGGTSDDVRFIDYDGTVLHTYSADDFLALTSMPENPTHEGLTSQGWNWTLEDAKTQVQSTGSCNIGQMYITNDGKTRIHIKLQKGRLIFYVGICPKGEVEIDWGDGTVSTVRGSSITTIVNSMHEYSAEGIYTIVFTVISGTFNIRGETYGTHLLKKSTSVRQNESYVYANTIKGIFLGTNVALSIYSFTYCTSVESITIPKGVTSIGQYAFQYCYNLSKITIPDGVTSIDNYAFQYCYTLSKITLPDGVTSIGDYAFQYCNSLSEITLPDGVTNIGKYAFQYCNSLSKITLPDSVTSIGRSAFANCNSLSKITLSKNVTSIEPYAFQSCSSLSKITIPDGVTSIGDSAFQYCNSLSEITLPDGITSIGDYAFDYCRPLKSIALPDSVTRIGNYAFRYCYSLSEITISDGVTNLGNNAFQYCSCLSNVTIPDSVTNIGNNAFQYCYGMAEYHFLSTTPPTLGGSSVFGNIPSECKIYVPAESLEAYKSAQYWSSHASKMVGE